MLMGLLVLGVGLMALILTRWLTHPDALIRILDNPNERSLHSAPVSRTGGIAICASLFAGWTIFAVYSHLHAFPLNILFGALIISGIAVVDDRHSLPAALRLLVQLAAVLLLINGGFVIQGELLPAVPLGAVHEAAIALTVLFALWLINLYNFMDGMDGFAGGMAVIGFGALAFLGWQQADMLFMGASLAVCAAASGFLWFNFPPARIFMGDSGSTTLGFLAAAFTVWASRRGVAAFWEGVLIFSPFIVDATVTLLRRLVRGERVWEAHRSHYYQRLVRMGWGHRRTVLAEYGLMLAVGASVVVAHDLPANSQWLIIGCWGMVYLITMRWIDVAETRNEDAQDV